MDDLNAASLEDVQEFYKRYYAPNNATIAIVGDFKTDERGQGEEVTSRVFRLSPRAPRPIISQPEQKADRRKVPGRLTSRSFPRIRHRLPGSRARR